ncbi:MAG: hypothetical protein ISS61_05590 [Desulfobacteraceae bacterium]|nr:hypothetical protein [Desulfobacteraceae bacterium]
MGCDGKPGVLSGLKRVHSFDLWGVVVDKHLLGQWKIETYEKLSKKEKVPEDNMKRVVREYRDLLDGKSWATGSRKSEIIDAIDRPALANGIRPYYASAFMKDALDAMREILDADEGVMIFTSKPASGLREQLAACLGERMGEIRWGNKSDPDAFREVYEQETQLGNRMVTHTADELPELIAARKSGLFHPNGLIHINRNDSNSEDTVALEGIHCYVDDLRDVKYTTLDFSP